MQKSLFFLILTTLLAALSPTWAQEHRPEIFPPFRPPIRLPRPIPLPAPLTELRLESQSAKVEIRGPLARTHLRQTLRNPLFRALEGSYLFALPQGAAVSNFAMTMNGKRLESEILEGDKAREIYNGIVQKLRDPAILEWVDRDLVRAKIFPVPAGGTVEIELDYAQTLNENRLVLPLRTPGASSADNSRASVEIAFDDADLRAVYSPSHSIETRRAGGKTLISGEFGTLERDFSLLWTRGGGKVNLQMLTSRGDEADGTFLLLAAPDPRVAKEEIAAKDVVFVFDTSGSMEGAKIEQARRALRTLLGNLNPRDRFNIVTFASSVQNFRDGLIPATPANLEAARRFADGIKAVGGTNINDALVEALKMMNPQTPVAGAAPQQIVFMTDGQPTVGETDVAQILKNVGAANNVRDPLTEDLPRRSWARLFVFGVGNDVNARLLDSLAQENRGASDYVTPAEDIETKVGALYEKIAFPVVSDARIDFGGLGVYDVYPPQLPDLFRGAQVAVFGRFRGEAKGKIALTGRAGAQNVRFEGAISGLDGSELPKLWATRKVAFLIDDARRANRPLADEVRDEIIKLSRKYGIVTPITAALITEDTPQLGRPLPSLSSNAPIFRRRDSDAASPMAARGGVLAESGEAGVAVAERLEDLRQGRSETVADVKTIAGKTFSLQNGVWTDSEFDPQKAGAPRVVKFASSEYFELLRDAKLAKWLSVGTRVVVVWKGQVLRIEL